MTKQTLIVSVEFYYDDLPKEFINNISKRINYELSNKIADEVIKSVELRLLRDKSLKGRIINKFKNIFK